MSTATICVSYNSIATVSSLALTLQSACPEISTTNATTVASTLLAISTSPSITGLTFTPKTLSLGPDAAAAPLFVKELVGYAHDAAAALSCGSVLAGQASETDEYADVGAWLGPGQYGEGHDSDVVKALGIGDGSEQYVPVHLTAQNLPETLSISTLDDGSLTRLTPVLSKLKDLRCFRMTPWDGPPVVYVLLGNYKEGLSQGWAGLVGLGVWSEDS